MNYNPKSAATALSRKKISLPVKWLLEQNCLNGSILDYGCGKGTDAKLIGADKYDPHYFPNLPDKKYNTIICIYVLNVVNPKYLNDLILNIKEHLLPLGTAYLAVRRDILKEGITSKGTEQWNVKLDLPILIEKKNKFCIYELTSLPNTLGKGF